MTASALLLLLFAMCGGILAGIINTLAGSGSLVTLPILSLLGLSSPVANATNRVGVVVQCVVASTSFRRQGLLPFYRATWLWLLPTVLGSILGAWIAVDIPERTLDLTLSLIMAAMLVVTLRNKKQFARGTNEEERDGERAEGDAPLPPFARAPSWKLLLTLFFVGVYGGFIQAGVGVMLLLVLVTGARVMLPLANGLKMLIALGLASVALVVFLWHGMIDWQLGLLMALGQSIGAWLGVRFLAKVENASLWVRRLLILILTYGIVHYAHPFLT